MKNLKTYYNELYKKGLELHHITNTAYPIAHGLTFRGYKITEESQIRNLLIGDMDKFDKISLYVHVPFCQNRCKFCEYTVASGDDRERKDEYVKYLLKEIDMYKEFIGDKPVIGFDMGGGTPTQLAGEQIKTITDYLYQNFNFEKNTEMSIETTPAIAVNDPNKMRQLYETGYRRISMGMQTIDPKLLEDFEREGGIALYEKAIENIRKAGFEKFNIDLMYGFLNQTLEEFEATIKYAISTNPEYITLYRNRYKGTKIVEEAEFVTLDKVNDQYKLAHQMLNETGYEGNYCKNTFSRLENDYGTSDYLTERVIKGTPYVGFGLGAQSFGHSYLAYNEGAKTKGLNDYIAKLDANQLPLQDIYDLPIKEAIAKMISVAFYFGFVDLDEFQKRFNINFEEYFKNELEFLEAMRLIVIQDGKMIVTEEGTEKIGGVIPMFYSPESQVELQKIKGMF